MMHKKKFELTALGMRENYHLLFLFSSFFIFAIDQITKYAIRANLSLGSSIPVIQDVFYLTYSLNTGVSFGMFKGHNWFFILVALFALVLFIYLYKDNKKYWPQLSLIIGGTAGNLVNRIQLGHVVDFINFKIWPSFNVADAALVIGIFWLILQSTISKEDLNLKSLKREFKRIANACKG
jgi:signal peptidase II